jgi:hypothetical protein
MTPSKRATWTAVLLWLVLAVAVWNVVFDRVLVLEGRRYVYEAALASRAGHYLLAGPWMATAVTRGLWLASAAAGALLATGLVAIAIASRGRRRRP